MLLLSIQPKLSIQYKINKLGQYKKNIDIGLVFIY